MDAIACDALTRDFDALRALDALTLRIPEGEVFGLLGPNGAGKTTAIKMLTTLLPPSGGAARVAGHDVVREALAVRRSIGYVPQVLSADGTLTGRENLAVFAVMYEVPRRERARRVQDALTAMGLAEAADRVVRTYSGGMVRRLEIAQSMVHRPRVLFLDEPTVGLDPVARRNVWGHIARLRAEHGMTVFLTTHYMEEAEQLCQRVGILHRGQLRALGSPQELIQAVGKPGGNLNDVFVAYTGEELPQGEGFGDVKHTRRTMGRMG